LSLRGLLPLIHLILAPIDIVSQWYVAPYWSKVRLREKKLLLGAGVPENSYSDKIMPFRQISGVPDDQPPIAELMGFQYPRRYLARPIYCHRLMSNHINASNFHPCVVLRKKHIPSDIPICIRFLAPKFGKPAISQISFEFIRRPR
jgi:hypothetical protein